MPLRTREPGPKDIGYLKYLARKYSFADGLMFAALRELEIYYLLHTPLDHRFVQEMGFNGRRGQRVHARFDGVPETAVCPYPVSFRDYLELEMVRNTDVYVQLPGLEVPEHTTVFKSDNRRATNRCARDVRLGSDEVYVWVRDLLLHGISPYSLSSALSRAGYKVSKDSGVITRAIHEIHSSLLTPGGKGELQRIMAETPMLGQSARSPLVRTEERIITPPTSLRGYHSKTDGFISFTGLDGKHYNYAYKCVTNITEFFNIFEISYFKYLYETYADHGAILDYIALYTPRAGFAGITPLLNGTHINTEMWKRTTGTNNCPYPIPFEAVHDHTTGTIYTPAELTTLHGVEVTNVETITTDTPQPEPTAADNIQQAPTNKPQEQPTPKPENTTAQPQEEEETEEPLVLTIPAPTPGTLAEAINKTSDTTIPVFLSRIAGTDDITTRPVEEVLHLAGLTLTDVLKSTGIVTHLAKGTVSELARSAGVEEMDVIMSGLT